MAFRAAMSGRPGPVYLELPCDVLNAAIEDPAKVKKIRTEVVSRPVDRENVRKVVKLLQGAKNPVLIAGSGAWYADAGEDLVALVDKTGDSGLHVGGWSGHHSQHPSPLFPSLPWQFVPGQQ